MPVSLYPITANFDFNNPIYGGVKLDPDFVRVTLEQAYGAQFVISPAYTKTDEGVTLVSFSVISRASVTPTMRVAELVYDSSLTDKELIALLITPRTVRISVPLAAKSDDIDRALYRALSVANNIPLDSPSVQGTCGWDDAAVISLLNDDRAVFGQYAFGSGTGVKIITDKE